MPKTLDEILARLEGYPDPGVCWLWTGAKNSGGYGYVRWKGFQLRVHRVTYTELVGSIPNGLQIDHVRARGCTSKLCANPAHLEPVTARENSRRHTSTITSCPLGHQLDRVDPRRGWRYGGTCARNHDRVNHRRYRAAKKISA